MLWAGLGTAVASLAARVPANRLDTLLEHYLEYMFGAGFHRYHGSYVLSAAIFLCELPRRDPNVLPRAKAAFAG